MANPHRILVVDDDRDIVAAMSIRLKALGYEVLTAFDGMAALTISHDTVPDIILMDIRMPRMDGLQVLAELRKVERTREIPVITVSGNIVDKQRALEQGARQFLTKPVDPKVLLQSIQFLVQPA